MGAVLRRGLTAGPLLPCESAPVAPRACLTTRSRASRCGCALTAVPGRIAYRLATRRARTCRLTTTVGGPWITLMRHRSAGLTELAAQFSGGRSLTDAAMTVGVARWVAVPWPQWRRGVSIGEVLAEARRQAGLTVTQVRDRTRIGERIIIAIEGDDYAACGGDFYARGHIRSLARAVGADPEPLIREYDSARLGPQALDDDVTDPITAVSRRRRPGPAGLVTAAAMARRQVPRRPSALAIVLAGAVVAGLGLAGFLLVNPGHGIGPSAGARRPASHHAGQASHAAPATPTATGGTRAAPAATTPAAPPRILIPASAAAFGFAGGQGDHSDLAHLAIDRNPATAWRTDWYATARFGNLYPGTGLLLDMGRPVTITAVRIRLGRAPGAGFQLRVGSAPALASLRPVAHTAGAGGVAHLRLTQPARGRYVLIWFTRLPPDPAGTFRESVYGLQVEGRT